MEVESQNSLPFVTSRTLVEREEVQLALMSALQELTVAALALFDPGCPVSEFMLRFAERLRWTAAITLELDPERQTLRLMGAGGLSGASVALPLPPPCWAGPGRVDWEAVALPYPELAAPGLQRWLIPFSTRAPGDCPRALLLYSPASRGLVPSLRGTVRRVVRVLQTAFTYRRMYTRLMEETTLLESESEAATDGILVVSPDLRVVYHTRRFLETWGFQSLSPGAPAEPVFQSAAELVADPEAFLAWIAQWSERPDEEATEELLLRDGRTLELHTVPIRCGSGQHGGRGWYFRDITERKQAEATRLQLLEQEREARTAAEEAVRERDEFLSMSAHELRTPVTRLRLRIDGLARMLETGRPTSTETMTKVRESLKKLTVLIDDLLDFSRVQAGGLPLQLQPCRIDALVEEVVESFKSVSPRHELVLEKEASELEVRADLARLEQVVSNLVENAIKYSPGGGTIRVKLSRSGDEAVITVSDPGIGIPEEEQRLLFSRFFRAANAPSRNFAGLGLGLFISREIVERHDGRISVQSELGHGSTFRVSLPLLRTGVAETGQPRTPRPADLQG